MRLPIAVAIAALLAAPAAAEAGTVALERTELVYRSSPGAEDVFEAREAAGVLTFRGREGGALRVTAGSGCTRTGGRVRCSLTGVTAVRVFAGSGDDLLAASVDTVPLLVDLGPGSDDFHGRAPTLTLVAGGGSDSAGVYAGGGAVDLGPGDDSAEIELGERFAGPLTVNGGDGRDSMLVFGIGKPGLSLAGGAGNDEFHVQTAPGGTGIDIACGPGDDSASFGLTDRPGDGCAPHLTVPAPQTVSRVFRGATLSAAAKGTVEFHRDPGPGKRGAVLLARGAFDAAAGPLRVRLKTTKAGRRWIGRDDRLKLFVTVKTRRGGDRNDVQYASRLG